MRKALLALLFITAGTLHAQAPPSFAKGVLAFEQKDWATAERLMREAIAGNPSEVDGTVRVSGEWFETYVPHYFLARALAKQGKCAEALKEFAESERQGVTPGISDFARHVASRDGCKGGAAPPKEKPAKVVTEIEVPFEEGAPAKPVTPTPAPTPVPAPKPVVNDIHQRLSSAVKSYLHGRYDESLRVLSSASFEGAAAGEAALLRAASRHALYRIGGEQDSKLRAQIDADLREYRHLRPDGRPDPRLFPPSFIALTR